jgi:hypothetical protein
VRSDIFGCHSHCAARVLLESEECDLSAVLSTSGSHSRTGLHRATTRSFDRNRAKPHSGSSLVISDSRLFEQEAANSACKGSDEVRGTY